MARSYSVSQGTIKHITSVILLSTGSLRPTTGPPEIPGGKLMSGSEESNKLTFPFSEHTGDNSCT